MALGLGLFYAEWVVGAGSDGGRLAGLTHRDADWAGLRVVVGRRSG